MKKLKSKNSVNQSKSNNILDYLEIIAQLIPAPFYWLDTKNILLGANDIALNSIGVTRDFAIGKSAFDVYPFDFAEKIVLHNQEVMKSRKISLQEEIVNDIHTGEIKYFSAMKAPLQDHNGKVIGLVGISMDITAQKEAERLKAEMEKRRVIYEQQATFQEFFNQLIEKITPLVQVIDNFKFSNLNNKLGSSQPKITTSNIKLTKREKEVLYCLSMNKSPKETAIILSDRDDKSISPRTVQSIIDTKLYVKFGAYSIGDLIEKAKRLNLIPFML